MMKQAESASNVHDALSRWISFGAADRQFCNRDSAITCGLAGYPDGFENQDVRFVYPTFGRSRRWPFSYGGKSSLLINQQVTALTQTKEKH